MSSWDVKFNPCIETHDRKLLDLIVEIEAYKRSVLKLPLPPGIKRMIDEMNIIRQIKGTTGIEGNTLTEEEIAHIVTGKNALTSPKLAEIEARNSWEVLRFIKENASTAAPMVSDKLITKLHYLTTKDCDYPDNEPGCLRSHNVVVGDYYPTPGSDVRRLVQEFINFINSREVVEGYGPLLRAILAHFYLISIHPFGDGNGRTSRGIEAYILYSAGYNVHGFYSLANYFYRNRHEYVEALQNARFRYDGRLTEFIKFSLNGFREELEHVQEQIIDFVRMLMFKDFVEELWMTNKLSYRSRAILKYMAEENQAISLEEYRSKKHYLVNALYEDIKSARTIQRDIKAMQEYDLIRIDNGKIYANLQIMDTIS